MVEWLAVGVDLVPIVCFGVVVIMVQSEDTRDAIGGR